MEEISKAEFYPGAITRKINNSVTFKILFAINQIVKFDYAMNTSKSIQNKFTKKFIESSNN